MEMSPEDMELFEELCKENYERIVKQIMSADTRKQKINNALQAAADGMIEFHEFQDIMSRIEKTT